MIVYRTASGSYVDPHGKPADAPDTASEPSEAVDFAALTVPELEKLAEGMEIEGSGKDGAVLKADLVAALSGA